MPSKARSLTVAGPAHNEQIGSDAVNSVSFVSHGGPAGMEDLVVSGVELDDNLIDNERASREAET